MNLDRSCILLVCFHLPILILPTQWLFIGIILGCGLVILGILWQKIGILLVGISVFFSYLTISETAKSTARVPVNKQEQLFEIQKILKQTDYQTAIARLDSGETVYLNWQSEQPLELHQRYQAVLNLRPISARSNIGNFDRQKWYFSNHINMISTVRMVERLEMEDKPFRTDWLNRVKTETKNLPTQGLLLALAFGERAWLNTEHWSLFQQTATAHLIAISGIHIALAMAFGFYFAKCVQWVCLKSQIKCLQAVGFSLFFARVIGFSAAFSYSYLAGFAVPTVRALFAIAFVLLCQSLRRHHTPLQFWWRIVAVLIVIDPLSLLSDSFWLSILAVLSLILWYRFFPISRIINDESRQNLSKFNRLLLSLLHLQVGIWLVFSPVQLYFFEGVSAFALIANLLIVPLYSFLLVPLVLLSLFTDNLFATWQLADLLAEWSLWLLEPLSHAWFILSDWQQWQLLSVNLLILLLIYCKSYNLPYKKWLNAVLFSLLFNSCFYLPKLFFQPKTEWIIFDVGQGLAMALIYDQNKAVIYDTGSSWKQSDGAIHSMAKLELLPYLKRNGIKVEAIFLSHDDNDHSGGMLDILNEYPTARVISASQVRYQHQVPEPCIQGQRWQFGEWRLLSVYPEKIVARAKNQDSCTLLVKNDRFSLLLTGDVGVEQERQFTQNIGEVDFLQVGHHGSKTSTSETLLKVTQPKIAVISASRWNPWKLPNHQIVARLKQHNIEVFNTAEVGMIRVKFYLNRVDIEVARGNQSPWYKQLY